MAAKCESRVSADAELRAAYFCERRELGVLNLGGQAAAEVDGMRFELAKFDALYVGRGSRDITFSSHDPANPASFYLQSYPAHTAYSTTPIPRADRMHLGTLTDASRRIIHR